MTEIKPEIVEYVRTFVRDDHEENDRIERLLDEEGWGDGFASYLAAVFYYAIDRRFGGKWSQSAVIQFVADMRAANPVAAQVDPSVAEAAIRAALDPAAELNVSALELPKTQIVAIHHAVADLDMTDSDLDDLLRKAERLAAR
ncbi:hypothetical protein O7543_23075 [Solwaraspora sp. WMMA2080]|uniref:hypothetical protein n=1 Tax=Solwaraspora sp. WMMA2080 TaxID=3015165 RepID=UPI00248BDD14|nr:hypothetical protein [Solwaraspora sp. WMMA2080]WBC19693.1 hypothetical protein O7543_23075 [Solwaraspora sp. WMMA2080]